MTQFMVGAPVVDYSSITFSASLGAFTGKIQSIDTSLPFVGSNPRTSFTDATAYTHYTNNLIQNRGTAASTATGTFTIVPGTTSYLVTHPTLGDSAVADALYSVSGTTGVVLPDTTTDLYDLNGNFVLTVLISSAAGEVWGTGISATFDVINPSYTDALNWADMCSTTRSGANSSQVALHFDTRRNLDLDPTDAMSLYDIQGLSFTSTNVDARAYPVTTLGQGIATTNGGFSRPDLYSNATNALVTHFVAGVTHATSDPAPLADRHADYFTIFRGPGYVRMLGQVSDPATGLPAASEADKDTSYFFGKFNSFEEVAEYPHPMAFLGDIGYRSTGDVANRTRPWWRASNSTMATTDSSIWSEAFLSLAAPYWTLTAPSILTHDFVMDDSSFNTPAQAKSLLPGGGFDVGRWYQSGTGTTPINLGSADDSKQMVTTEFNGQMQSVAWDPVVGWDNPMDTFYTYLETPGAPRVLPVTLRQLAPDDNRWSTTQDNAQTIPGTYSGQDVYENIGTIPGMYWMNHIETYAGAGATLYPAGSEFVTGGRTLRMVIGFSQSYSSSAYMTPVPATNAWNTGNLLFDMNEI